MTLSSMTQRNYPFPNLGLGCWAFGGGQYWGPVSQSDVDAVVRYAVDHGCNFFDTAEVYNQGASEVSLGKAIRGLDRSRLLIGSKISPSNAEPEKLAQHCEASLRRLGTDYLDLYMVHWPITAHSIRHFRSDYQVIPSTSEAFLTLKKLRDQGKIRHIGVCNFGVQKLTEALETGVSVISNELPYNLLSRAIELEILPFCRKQGVNVIGYMALMQGLLGRMPASMEEVPVAQRRTRHFDSRKNPECRHGLNGSEQETMETLKAICLIAHRSGMSLPEISLKWAMSRSGISTTLCGSCKISNLKRNIEASQTDLTREVIEELNQVTQPLLKVLGPSFDYYEHPDNDRTKDLPCPGGWRTNIQHSFA